VPKLPGSFDIFIKGIDIALAKCTYRENGQEKKSLDEALSN
jgi:hypothetical protein